MQYPPPRRMPMDWVATPPPGPSTPAPPRRFTRYTGPPSYRTPPRWGFPALAWRWPTAVPTGTEAAPIAECLRVRARFAVVMLTMLSVFAVLTAAAEIWRYVLLVEARTSALRAGTVDLSDSLVITGAYLTLFVGAAAIAATLWWLVPARQAAAEVSGYESARPATHVVLALLIPGLNLLVPGAAAAELEHAALRRPADERPSPSKFVRWWWATLCVSGALFAATLLWRLRDGVQARADGVLLTAATDVAAAVFAAMTLVLVVRLSALLAPVDPASARLMRVIRVEGAPAPPLRTSRQPGAKR
ncbi:DUF4328 domain-containing protein [Actinokineospora alba]|nr:DUF4328 domain-containing protein [Actinokineospora alba]